MRRATLSFPEIPMKPRSTVLTCLASIAMLAFVSPAASAAQGPGAASAKQSQKAATSVAASKSAQGERTQMSRAFATKWSTYAQRIYGVPANVWVQRMAFTLANADATNLRNALQRDTFEGAMAELSGAGAKLSDAKVINFLAASKDGNITAQTLGALANDLVYTPVQPCRIIDTRNAGGVIGAGSTRSFKAIDSSNFTSQGGSATNCGTLGFRATAVAVNLTAVTPTSSGYATAFPFGTTQPTASSINYTAGAIVANELILPIPNPLAVSDFSIFTYAQSDYVADIVGYFAPPVATELQCVTSGINQPSVPAGVTDYYSAPSCPAGYKASTPYCWGLDAAGVYSTGSGLLGNGATSAAFCGYSNTTASAKVVWVGSQCCRVPGR